MKTTPSAPIVETTDETPPFVQLATIVELLTDLRQKVDDALKATVKAQKSGLKQAVVTFDSVGNHWGPKIIKWAPHFAVDIEAAAQAKKDGKEDPGLVASRAYRNRKPKQK